MSNRKRAKGLRDAARKRAAGKTPVRDDGRKYNGYICNKCKGVYLSVDLDDGVTPMFMPCLSTEGCDEFAMSMGYPKSPAPVKVPLLVEWYTPADTSLGDLPKDLFGHVMQGGLLRRPTEDAPEWVKEKLGPVFPRHGE